MKTAEASAAPNSPTFGSQKVGVDQAKEDVTPRPEYAYIFQILVLLSNFIYLGVSKQKPKKQCTRKMSGWIALLSEVYSF
jgi:hypothetical protein